MKNEYDFTKGVRGKYADRVAKGVSMVVLDPDVAEAFPTSDEVNAALRKLLALREEGSRVAKDAS